MRLNLGCGSDRREGWVNVDHSPLGEPDQVVDLERLPWPWPDNAAAEVLLRHVLEHLAPQPAAYLGLMAELWRICRHGAEVRIIVPHPRHDSFLNDPTHVRAITPEGLEMFSQARNRQWRDQGLANSPLGLQLGIDFDMVSVDLRPDARWRGRLDSGEITADDLREAMRHYNNVIVECEIVLRAIKAAA